MATVTYSLRTVLDEFTIAGGAGGQLDPSFVFTSDDGSFAVSWTDRQSGSEGDVFYARFNAKGDNLAPDGSQGVSTGGGADNEFQSEITVLNNGNILIVNSDDDGSPGTRNVEWHIRSAETGGTIVGQNIVPAIGQATDAQSDPAVAVLDNGRFVIAYTDQFGGSTTNTNAEVVLYNDDGTIAVSAFIAGGGATSQSVNSADVAALSDGGFVVTWAEDLDPGIDGNFDIKARRYDAGGNVVGGEITVVDETDRQSEPAAIGLPNGNFAIAYVDQFNGSTTRSLIEMDVYDASGAVIRNEITVDSPPLDVFRPDLVVISDTLFAIVWDEEIGPGNVDLRGRIYDFDGTAVTDVLELNSDSLSSQVASSADSIGGGRLGVAWEDGGGSIAARNVQGQIWDLVRRSEADPNEKVVGDDLRDVIIGNSGDEDLRGKDNDDKLRGKDGDDTLKGGAGGDELEGGNGEDRLEGGSGKDSLSGGDNKDRLFGDGDRDTLRGGDGNDILRGGDGGDTLRGGNGSDNLNGGDGNDSLRGNKGKDILTGGNGKDTFEFTSQSDSGKGGSKADDIIDFKKSQDDVIDLESLVQGEIVFRGDRDFRAGRENQLITVDRGDDVRVRIDFDGDQSSDFDIDVLNINSLREVDFLL